MRASHREVRKKILDRMSKIDDKEFFTSRAYRGYLADITESATKRYRRPIRVNLFADETDQTVAYTDYSGMRNARRVILENFTLFILEMKQLPLCLEQSCLSNYQTKRSI